MKLVSFSVPTKVGSVRRIGALNQEDVVDLTAALERKLAHMGEASPSELAGTFVPPDMVEFLRRGETGLTHAREALEFAGDAGKDIEQPEKQIWYNQDEVRLLSPLPRPNSIRDCVAFEQHILNSRGIPEGSLSDVWYEFPIHYKGNPDAVVHPGDSVQWPNYTEKLDYELELAAVIGREGKNIAAEDAYEYIVGFTIFNDFSARDIQAKLRDVKLGPTKGKDFANGFGPCIVTADEIDIDNVGMRAWVNGELWSEGNASEMYHSWGDIIEFISDEVSLYPGDVIGSGTVSTGCCAELGKWIDPGDEITLEVDGIGELTHTVVRNNQ